MLDFFKDKWNILLNLSLSVVALLTQFVTPPKISLYVFEGSINYPVLAKFVVISVLLITIYPCIRFNKKGHGIYWWIIGMICLVIALMFYLDYNQFSNRKTAYNEYAGEREVIGDHLLPAAKKAVDSVKAVNKMDTITADAILESLGRARENWPFYEIAENSRILSIKYLAAILFFALFLVVSIQAVYCAGSKT